MSIHRRRFLQAGAFSTVMSMSGWLGSIAAAAAKNPQRKRSCILLWMTGGPSTIDLWDLKPNHENGGEFKPIEAAPGLQISEHLPGVAKFGKNLAVIRSMSTKEGDHFRATQVAHTGQRPMGAINYPSIGSLLSKELGSADAELPSFVSIGPSQSFGSSALESGYLGPRYAPLTIGQSGFRRQNLDDKEIERILKVDNLQPSEKVPEEHADARFDLLLEMQRNFTRKRPGAVTDSHASAYERASRLMRSSSATAFDFTQEKAKDRDRYGRTLFGQGCLLARRLVEREVPFVEVMLPGWDTHNDNFKQVKDLSGELDKAWSALMTDLQERGLLDSTLIVCMGEFGRTPRINPRVGRDHFPAAWSVALAGGGIHGGQAYGTTSNDGTTVEENPVSTIDLLSTICHAVGVDPDTQNLSNVGRPLRIVDRSAKPVREILA